MPVYWLFFGKPVIFFFAGGPLPEVIRLPGLPAGFVVLFQETAIGFRPFFSAFSAKQPEKQGNADDNADE